MSEEAITTEGAESSTAIIDITSEKEIEDLKASTNRLIVNFWAPWAKPCEQMNTIFTTLHTQHASAITFTRVEASQRKAIADKHGIKTVPTFLFFANGRIVKKLQGANAERLAKSLTWLVETSADGLLTSACEYLIGRSEIVLLLKGSGSAPKCAFCRRVVSALRNYGIVFDGFDVLMDSRLRERVKEVARWETFPMLFASGRLIGGVDAVERLADEKRLISELTRRPSDAMPEVGADVTEERAAVAAEGKVAQTVVETEQKEEEESVNQRLERLVRRETIMLFMKGVPGAPRCGFSRRIVDLLNKEGVSFSSFDILTDETVRQGLKTFSQWPTFPQLYAHGRFIGGLDVISELASVGELSGELSGELEG